MALNNRYSPSHPQGQVATYGLDYSNIIPLGITLESATLTIESNTVPPQPSTDFTMGPVTTNGRRVYCQLSGGVAANDYRLTWTAADSLGNTWPRSTLLLCAATS